VSPEFYIRIDARHLEKCKAAHIHLGREECFCPRCDEDEYETECRCDTCDEEKCWCHEEERGRNDL